MRVVQLLCEEWEIVAVRDRRGICQVYEFLDHGVSESLQGKMNAVLNHVAFKGPKIRNKDMVRHLRGAIWEFKRGAKRGPKFRILYFGDDGLRRVVCTFAFLKTDKTPQNRINDGQAIKDEYEGIKGTAGFEVVSIEEYLDERQA